MITDLVTIRSLSEARKQENTAFRRFIHDRRISDEPLRSRAAELLRAYDCRSCANCCRDTRVQVSEDEISTIAAHIGMKTTRVAQLYTEPGEDSQETLLKHTGGGCVFLHCNECLVYQARPAACRAFPPIARNRASLGSRLSSVCRQAAICPVVFDALEDFKRVTGFVRR